MIEYVLDAEKSRELFLQHRRSIKEKECYNNIFRVATEHWDKINSQKWKIAYGYMTLLENILCRHCFIIDENDKILDPTIFKHRSIDLNRRYFVMKVFDNTKEYLCALEKEKRYPALYRTLYQHEKQAWEWAMKNNFILTG